MGDSLSDRLLSDIIEGCQDIAQEIGCLPLLRSINTREGSKHSQKFNVDLDSCLGGRFCDFLESSLVAYFSYFHKWVKIQKYLDFHFYLVIWVAI